MNEFDLLQDKLGDNVLKDVELAQFTTFRIGGPAKFFYRASSPRQFVRAYDTAAKNRVNYFILGGGSNVLFADEGFRGLVVKDDCCEYIVDGELISSQSGVWLDDLVDIAT
ncbi:MAG: hypothetical protein GY839_14545, partial [candidate division Zixibacteria bacterium]|nr:hypothetical protein [candidate division Zixibacteria bacterium]